MLEINKPDENAEVLDSLEERGLMEYTEDGMPVKTPPARHLREIEVCCMLLPYVVENIKISSRELSRKTNLDHRVINRFRNSETFAKMLVEHVNKQMLTVRCLAVEELTKLLQNPKLNPSVKVKAIQTALSHTERMTELMLQAGKEVPKIDVNLILKELENM